MSNLIPTCYAVIIIIHCQLLLGTLLFKISIFKHKVLPSSAFWKEPKGRLLQSCSLFNKRTDLFKTFKRMTDWLTNWPTTIIIASTTLLLQMGSKDFCCIYVLFSSKTYFHQPWHRHNNTIAKGWLWLSIFLTINLYIVVIRY